MRRHYIEPYTEIISTESLLEDNVHSYGLQGAVNNGNGGKEPDTGWYFGGEGSSTDTPDAKGNNIWDEEDDIW